MSSAKLCYECLAKDSELFCTCNQVFLCLDCIIYHKKENCLVIRDTNDIKTKFDAPQATIEEVKQISVTSIEVNNFKNELIETINNIIRDIKTNKEQVNKIIDKSSKFSIFKANSIDSCRINLRIDEKLKNMIDSVNLTKKYIYLQQISEHDRTTWIYKIDLETLHGHRLFKFSNKPISSTIIQEIDNCLYFIGGQSGFEIMTEISKYDLNIGRLLNIGLTKHKMLNYDCVTYKNMIFFIGGRISNMPSREILNLVTPFNVDTQQYEESIRLIYPRYRTSGVIHKSKLWVVSTNKNGRTEILDLENMSGFNEASFPIICLTDCEMISVDNYIYFLNKCEDNRWRIGRINDKCESEIISQNVDMGEATWRKKTSPVYIKGRIYFIGEVSSGEIESLKIEIKVIELTISDFSIQFKTIRLSDS